MHISGTTRMRADLQAHNLWTKHSLGSAVSGPVASPNPECVTDKRSLESCTRSEEILSLLDVHHCV